MCSLRKVSRCFRDLVLLFREESRESNNVGVDGRRLGGRHITVRGHCEGFGLS